MKSANTPGPTRTNSSLAASGRAALASGYDWELIGPPLLSSGEIAPVPEPAPAP